jgi:ATP-dependent RNA helicase DeaD
MSGSFAELGLSEQLAANAADVGYDAPTELQRNTIPVLRRGNNVVLTASSGAGATAAYALALLDRFAEADAPRALVLAPTAERAHQIARTIGQLASGTKARVATLGEGWRNPATAGILVATPGRVQQAMGSSELSFDSIESVIVDQADNMSSLGGSASLSEILAALPREGQRVFVAGSYAGELQRFVETHARKALHFPPRPAVAEERDTTPAIIGTVRYIVGNDSEKLEILARFISRQREDVRVLCRSRRAVTEVQRELEMRGFDAEVTNYVEAVDNYGGRTYAYDVPATADQLGYLQDGDVIICTPSEVPHVKRLAEVTNVDIAAIRDRSKGDETLESFRAEIREAARNEDLSAQMLVLQPLFDEMSAVEVAAALSSLLRARRPARAEQQPSAGRGAAGQKTWSRLFVSIGERDGVSARDVVGAITGEANVTGEDVGKVEVRDTFSVIEVASTAAEKVIKALNGTTMKGRSLRVDYDRKSGAGGGDRKPRSDRGPRPERGARPEHGPRADRSSPSDRGPRRSPGKGGTRGGGGGDRPRRGPPRPGRAPRS